MVLESVFGTCAGWVLIMETIKKDKVEIKLQCTPTEMKCIRVGAEKEVDLRMKGLDTSKNYEFACIKNPFFEDK
jgi:glutamine amidotransferase PdxT